jgi:short-subunit dehydrogenase
MKVLIIGATSAIAHEAAKGFAAQGAELLLVGRNAERLAANQQDLKVHGATRVETDALDLSDVSRHLALIDRAVQTLGEIDYALIAHGTLPDQKQIANDVNATLAEFATNGSSFISLMTLLATYFESRRRGTLAVISSPAGERGRGSNYLYGAARAAVTAYASGLRNRLGKLGVQVITIKPGFVDTPMTASMKKNFLFASAKTVGTRIHAAMLKGEDVVWTPPVWMLIMLIIRNIPERVFKKLSL